MKKKSRSTTRRAWSSRTCSRERCAGALKTLPDEEIDSILADEGEIDMHCDYCGNHYIFNAMDIAEIRNNALRPIRRFINPRIFQAQGGNVVCRVVPDFNLFAS